MEQVNHVLSPGAELLWKHSSLEEVSTGTAGRVLQWLCCSGFFLGFGIKLGAK